jgi:non-heme chloroperoxidase
MYQTGSLSKTIEGTERIITTNDGSKIYCVESGNGSKTIVLAHGYGFTMQEWNVIAPNLTQLGYRVIAFDQQGHGKSTISRNGLDSDTMASFYLRVFEEFDIQDAILVGHSMGGFLGMKALIKYPELQKRISGCILMATFAGEVNKNNPQNKVQIPLIQYGILLKLIKIKAIGRAFAKSLLGENPDNEAIRIFLEIFQAQNHKALIPIIKAMGSESYYAELHKIKVPCTVIIGSMDKTTPPFHTEDLVKMIPNAKKVVLERKGHGLNWEAPDSIVSEIIKMAG